jgi:hypothetical protein
MGLFRKTVSLSTLGAVDYRSKREGKKRAVNADAKLARQEAKLAKAQRKALKRG